MMTGDDRFMQGTHLEAQAIFDLALWARGNVSILDPNVHQFILDVLRTRNTNIIGLQKEISLLRSTRPVVALIEFCDYLAQERQFGMLVKWVSPKMVIDMEHPEGKRANWADLRSIWIAGKTYEDCFEQALCWQHSKTFEQILSTLNLD